MAVPAAASGRTKGSGRLGGEGGAGLGSRRSPERGAGASRKSRSGPRSRHPRRLSRRGSSRSALSPPPLLPHARDAEADAGPLGFFRNELGSRRPKARLRGLPPLQSPTRLWALPAAEKTGPARLGVRLLPEHLRSSRRTRPGARLRSESETPELGHFRKQFGSLRPTAAPRSVISVAARPLLRRREELRLTLSSREPCRSACGRKSRTPVRFAGLFASGFACHLHERSPLPHPFRASFCLNSPPPQDPGGAQPPRPIKGLGGDFAFGLLPLSRLRESGSRLGQPGSASGSIQCVQGCRSPPPGKRAFRECPQVEERVGSRSRGVGWGGATPQDWWVPSGSDQTSREEAGDREGVREGVASAGPAPPAPSTRH